MRRSVGAEKPILPRPKQAYQIENYADDTNVLIEEVKNFGSFESEDKDVYNQDLEGIQEELENEFDPELQHEDDHMRMNDEELKKKFNEAKRNRYRKKTVKLESKIVENSLEESASELPNGSINEEEGLDVTCDRMIVPKTGKDRWVSNNQKDSLASNKSSLSRYASKQGKEDSFKSSDFSITEEYKAPNLKKMRPDFSTSAAKLTPGASKFGELILDNLMKTNTNVKDSHPNRKNSLLNKIKGLGKKLNMKNKVISSSCTKNVSNPLQAMKSNMASRMIDGTISENQGRRSSRFNFLDEYLLNNEESKNGLPSLSNSSVDIDSKEFNFELLDISRDFADSSDSKNMRDKGPGNSQNKRKGIKIKDMEQMIQTSKNALIKSKEKNELKRKNATPGDSVFQSILEESTLNSFYAVKASAEYYHLAFRDTQIFHFVKGS